MTGWSRRAFVAAGAGTIAAPGVGAAAAAPVPREVPLLGSYVAGAERRVVRALARDLVPGAELRLEREPGNDYDSRAVAVRTRSGQKLGYVPRVDNQALANLMDAGLAPRATLAEVRSAGRRPDLRIEVWLPLG